MTPRDFSAWAHHAAQGGGCCLLAGPAQARFLARLSRIQAEPYIDMNIHQDVALLSIGQLGGAWYDIPVRIVQQA